MLTKGLLVTVILVTALGVCCRPVLAQDEKSILGTWESYNQDKGEFTFVTFAADSVLTVEVYDAERGEYAVDEDHHQFGWFDRKGDDKSEPDWADYKLDGDRLTIFQEEQEIPLMRIWQPEKPANELAGRWKMVIDEIKGIDELRESGEEIPDAFIVDLANNGTALTMELDKKLSGKYSLDAKAATFEFNIEDEKEAGSYKLDDNRLVLVVDGEELVYERTK